MTTQSYQVDAAPAPVGAYPHAKRVANLLFLSGIGPRTPGSNAIPGNEYDEQGSLVRYDFEAQCHSVFRNVLTVLQASNASFDNLVDVTVYLTNMQRDFAAYNRIYSQYFKSDGPCRTTLGITSLPTPIAIELKCIAAL
jgi:2-aminomuconate deaminase